MRSASASSLGAAALLAAFALIAGWNAARYPSSAGYDVPQHEEYADLLVHEGRLPGPETRSEYYTPPGFYALAGVATVIGEHVHSGDPHKLGQALNWLVLLATAGLLLLLARELFPGRPWLQLGALGFFCFLPVVLRTGAMFHPEPLSMLLSTAALLLAARILGRGDRRLWPALACGAALGAGQLVRAFSLWTFAAVAIAFLVAARREPRRPVLVSLAAIVAATAVLAGPWYVRQAVRYGDPVFDRPQPSKPIWERRPASFYFSPGIPQVFTDPFRPHFVNKAVPTTYADVWGDYFGAFAWKGRPTGGELEQLRRQSGLGLVPTAMAVAGWLALLVAARRSPARLAAALLPGLGLLGYLYFTVSYPTADGDVLKASYMLSTAPAWALGFGVAADRVASLGPIARAGLLALLVGSAALALPLLLYGHPLGFL